ncbi:AAA family ATPase [Odoribacter sp. OttesenSCG-928-L07]|nr:AAA family ATPase [Odoribacter sp. OttesenSCG-928-L07]MDL2239694.1 AAA family ATPase [Bacteroidales bacterium OttesenSCG-928-L14]MDL2240386.1 AAA family ATPase [Bacteroidales bacterium OttesenSCG-928-K22]
MSEKNINFLSINVDYNQITAKSDNPENYIRSVFRESEGKHLHFLVKIIDPSPEHGFSEGNYEVRLFNILDNNYEFLYVQKFSWSVYNSTYFEVADVITDLPLPQGEYAIGIFETRDQIKGINNALTHAKFDVVNLPESYMQCVEFEVFGLYKKLIEEELDISKVNSQSCFNIADLDSISLVFVGSSKLEHDWKYELFVKVYDSTGRIIQKMSNKAEVCLTDEDEDNNFISIIDNIGEDYTLEKGSYKVEIDFLNEKMLVASFEIGDIDLESLYNKDMVFTEKRSAGSIVVTADKNANAFEQINALVGLTEVKDTLRKYSDRVKYNRNRQALGLPTKSFPLHAAFVGNPGTGKTTVAHLIGAAFKDLGLLSSGHVVFEERSTLIGQFYGSENERTLKALEKAKGGVLVIDEANNLFTRHDPKDPGPRVLETLMTALSDENNRDWMLILAGYPGPMSELLNSNPGLRSRIPNVYNFHDFNIDELMQISDLYCTNNKYTFTDEAKEALHLHIKRQYSIRDESFENGRFILNLLEKEIVPALADRVLKIPDADITTYSTIERCDIPVLEIEGYEKSMEKLNEMTGLNDLKKQIEDHLNFVKFVRARSSMGIHTSIPPLHMVFTGNPGTGKTTVANLIGKIYASMGILSNGDVIKTERTNLVGKFIGDTESNMKAVLQNARGNVLFIDEAYNLFVGDEKGTNQDYGNRVIESLLTVLSQDEIDMIVVLAGYPKEMDAMLSSNPGLKSRFPYTFHFEDYTADELMQIGESYTKRSGYTLSEEAKQAMRASINKAYSNRDEHFGNARFIVRLVSTQIIPNMSRRLMKMGDDAFKDKDMLCTILPEDIPISVSEIASFKDMRNFNEEVIANALKQLDSLVAMEQIKANIHDFVKIARYQNEQGKDIFYNLKYNWTFAGNTGTGKSAVAKIIAEIFKGMHLLKKGHVVELKAEQIYSTPDYQVEEILKNAIKKAENGLLFIDGDAPMFKNRDNFFDSERLRHKLSLLTAESAETMALIITENEVSQGMVNSLLNNGIQTFDYILFFEDYNKDELISILKILLQKEDYTLDTESEQQLENYISCLCEEKDLGYANARTMAMLAQSIIRITQLRESKDNSDKKGVVIAEDVKSFTWKGADYKGHARRKIGFH